MLLSLASDRPLPAWRLPNAPARHTRCAAAGKYGNLNDLAHEGAFRFSVAHGAMVDISAQGERPFSWDDVGALSLSPTTRCPPLVLTLTSSQLRSRGCAAGSRYQLAHGKNTSLYGQQASVQDILGGKVRWRLTCSCPC